MKPTVKDSDEKESQSIELLAPYRGNLVFSFALDRLHLGIPGVVVATFVALSPFNILLNALQGTLLPTPHLDSVLWNSRWVTHWTSVPIIYPTLAGVAVVIYRRIPLMFRDLIDSGVLVIPSSQSPFFANLQKRYQSRAANLVIVLCLIIFFVGWVIVTRRQKFPCWMHNEPGDLTIAAWYWIFAGTVSIYVLLHLAYTILVTFQSIRTVFGDKSGFTIALKFMHPDRCCGLRPLSKFMLRVGLFLTLLGIANSIHILASYHRLETIGKVLEQIGPIFCVVGYVLFAPLAFFLPLLPAHRVMRDSKHLYQMQISHEFDRRLGHLSDRIARGQLDESEHSQLDVLRSYQQYVDAFPVWPFDITTLSRFAGMVLLPLMLTVLGILFQKLFE